MGGGVRDGVEQLMRGQRHKKHGKTSEAKHEVRLQAMNVGQCQGSEGRHGRRHGGSACCKTDHLVDGDIKVVQDFLLQIRVQGIAHQGHQQHQVS